MYLNLDVEVTELYESFTTLTNYEEKIIFFDQHFGIIPFNFPEVDVDVSWYQSAQKLHLLEEIFSKDSYKSKVYQKDFLLENDSYSFDINPANPIQRVILNRFILSKLLQRKKRLYEHMEQQLKDSIDPILFYEDQIKYVGEKINWVRKQVFQDQNNISLKDRFLTVMHRGVSDFLSGSQDILKIRRKFIELFLYSEGYLLAEHLQELKTRLQVYQSSLTLKKQLSLPQKIILLHKLGMLDLLKEKFGTSHKEKGHQTISDLVCLLTNTDFNQQELVYLLIAFIGKGESYDLLNSYNHQLVDDLLQTYA